MPFSTDPPQRRPEFDAKGLARHGADWDGGVVLRALSRGPGIAVAVRHPRNGAPPRRVLGGAGTVDFRGGVLYVTPASAPSGTEMTLTVEF